MSSCLLRKRHQNGTGCENIRGKKAGAGGRSLWTTVQVWPQWEERGKEGRSGKRRSQLSRALKKFSKGTVESSCEVAQGRRCAFCRKVPVFGSLLLSCWLVTASKRCVDSLVDLEGGGSGHPSVMLPTKGVLSCTIWSQLPYLLHSRETIKRE